MTSMPPIFSRGTSNQKTGLYICLILIALIGIIYGQTYRFDTVLCEEKSAIRVFHQGFTTDVMKQIFCRTPDVPTWSPVAYLTCMLDSELFGDKPGPRHLVNVFLHICSTIILFLIFSRTTGEIYKSGFLAALFAVHPLNVEPVAWLALHESSLSTFFVMVGLLTYANYSVAPDKKKYCLIIFIYVLGLMSHARAIVFPFLLILFDYWPLQRIFARKGKNIEPPLSSPGTEQRPISVAHCIKEKLPFLIIAFLWLIGSFYIYTQSGYYQLESAAPRIGFSIKSHLPFVFVSYVTYIIKIFIPFNLLSDNSLAGLAVSLTRWQIIISVIFLIAISALFFIKSRRDARVYIMGWLWFLITMAPSVILNAVKQTLVTGRYSYLGTTGIFLIIAWGIGDLLLYRRYKNAGIVSAVLLILLLTYISWSQTRHWRNEITFYEHATSIMPDNPAGYQILAAAFLNDGQPEKAVQTYYRALQFAPNSSIIYNKIGILFADQMEYQRAMTCFKKAIQLTPDGADAYHNMGNVLLDMGETDKAIAYFEKALQNDPSAFQTHSSLATALVFNQQFSKAIEHLNKALEINPDYAPARNNLRQVKAMKSF